MKLKKVSCFNVSRFRVLAEDFFALTVNASHLLDSNDVLFFLTILRRTTHKI